MASQGTQMMGSEDRDLLKMHSRGPTARAQWGAFLPEMCLRDDRSNCTNLQPCSFLGQCLSTLQIHPISKPRIIMAISGLGTAISWLHFLICCWWWVYMHMSYVLLCVCKFNLNIHAQVCTNIWRSESLLDILPQFLATLVSWGRVSRWAWNH